ncbi:MAG: IspD/TarI family cytidylyltransferase [Liquorilactobacillus ghanensis]|uniref:IspD/TarI family cytidylyltransferase n=1 Tax=Liquorilactobacillus ghanensis TaxID=399370 RepID=UPI0039E8ED7F
MNLALIIAGGVGRRMHQDIPKQFLTVDNRPVIIHTLEAFQKHPSIDAIAVACVAGWEKVLRAYAKQFNITKLKFVVPGGENGQDSIRNGLFELEKHYDKQAVVLIHDAIRPMISEDIISDCIVTVQKFGSAIATIPCAEAMMETENGQVSIGSYPREKLLRAQTPQGFRLGKLCSMHRKALAKGITNSVASCTMFAELGEKVHFSLGSEKNIKLTTTDDLEIFKALLSVKKTQWLKH